MNVNSSLMSIDIYTLKKISLPKKILMLCYNFNDKKISLTNYFIDKFYVNTTTS